MLSLVLIACCAAPAAQAAYPGQNGRIAYVTSSQNVPVDVGQIWTVEADGTAPQQLTNPTPPIFDSRPSWSPDGTRIAFARGNWCCAARQIYIVNADGSGERLLTSNATSPTWSPDGTEIAFAATHGHNAVWRINADGTNPRVESYADDEDWNFQEPAWSPKGDKVAFGFTRTVVYWDGEEGSDPDIVDYPRIGVRQLYDGNPWTGYGSLPGGEDPEWSPDGAELVYVASQEEGYPPIDIKARNADGSGAERTIVGGPETDRFPAWSPDGAKIVFSRDSPHPDRGLWVVGADGSAPTPIVLNGTQPDWQPLQRPYARPAGATPTRVSLVPAFAQCTSENRIHGPPLAFPSCNPPQPASPNIAVSNGEQRIGSVGYMRIGVIAGEPGGTDDADLRLVFRLTNVMNKSDLSDYTGVLQPELVVRLTDRQGFQSQTTQDFPFRYQVPCVATDTAVGGLCALTTTAEAIVPGSVTEGARAIWALDTVRVYDGGPAGDGANASLFATQGYFVP